MGTMTDTTLDQLTAMVEGLRGDLLTLDRGDVPADLDGYDSDEYGSALDYWLAVVALEMYAVERRYFNGQCADPDHFVVVVTVGGPHVEVLIRENGDATVVGRWGSDKVERYCTVKNLAGQLFELYEA